MLMLKCLMHKMWMNSQMTREGCEADKLHTAQDFLSFEHGRRFGCYGAFISLSHLFPFGILGVCYQHCRRELAYHLQNRIL